MLRCAVQEVGLEPAPHVFVSLIACCAYLHMPKLGRSLFSDMRERGIAPSLHAYNALLKMEAHCGGGLDAALRLVQVIVP
jgi:pentatricopeptide repeat protein